MELVGAFGDDGRTTTPFVLWESGNPTYLDYVLRGVSQTDMATALGVSSAYLSALEHGRRGRPTWATTGKHRCGAITCKPSTAT